MIIWPKWKRSMIENPKGAYDHIGFIPVPRLCDGRIVNVIDSTIYEVMIYRSPRGKFSGPIQCGAFFPPGMNDNYKINDIVKVMVHFLFGGQDNKYSDIATGHPPYIVGTFRENALIPKKIDAFNAEKTEDTIGITNKNSGAGLTTNDYGHVAMATNGIPFQVLKPGGSGQDKDLSYSFAQNFKRVVSNNSPLYLTREYFGMYSGKDLLEETSKIDPTDIYINRRSFIQANTGFDDWVSTCEGHFSPFVGANNLFDSLTKTKESIYCKIINKNKNRVTIEAGEDDSHFFQIRVDEVVVPEKAIPVTPGASPAMLLNRMKFLVDSNGDLTIFAGGKGTAGAGKYQLIIKQSGDELQIFSSGKMVLSHSEADVGNNSISLDPKKGVDIIAKNGFRINGSEVLLKAFLDWFDRNKTMFGIATTIGAPVPFHPKALAEFETGKRLIADTKGFTSKNTGVISLGNNISEDLYRSV